MKGTAAFGALSDLRVIDLTQMLAGPYGTMVLADHGAEVIKVEPLTGDMTRTGGPYFPEDRARVLGGYFQSVNRNKRSVCLDLKASAGRHAFLDLVRSADVVVENFRAGVMERLGLGYETLRETNPKLVYAALRGFGDPRTGASPYVEWPAFDVVAQAMGGIMAITGPDSETPTKVGPGVGDIVPGLMLAFGILAAHHNAMRTGRGQFVDVAMTDAMLAVCERTVWQHSVQGLVPGPEGNHHPFLCPFGVFPARDGHVALAAHQDAVFPGLCERLEAPALAKDPRFTTQSARSTHRRDLIVELGRVCQTFSKSELTERLGGWVPYGPVMNIEEIARDPHFSAREMLQDVDEPGLPPLTIAGVPVKLSETPGAVRTRGPRLGEHTRSTLLDSGLAPDRIDALVASGCARDPSA